MLKKLKKLLNKSRTYCETEINKQEFKKFVEQGAIILDVRSPQEFAEGHIDGAVLLPEYEITEKASEILKEKSQKIIVYCSTGHRSKRAQKILQNLGYKKVYNLCNGLENYD